MTSASIISNGIKRAALAVKNAEILIITAGAGIGVDSGIPDFRGPQGFWKAYPPLKERGLTLPEMSTPHWFDTDPKFAWGFFGHRYNIYKKAVPHHGFQILKKWTKSKQDKYFIFTSNVDGQFQVAGFDENKIVECHGSIHFMQCVDSGRCSLIWPVPDDFKIEIDDKTLTAIDIPKGPPEKPIGYARPNILMFGDWSWVAARTSEQEVRMHAFMEELRDKKLVVLEIGAGLAVPTVRYISESLVRGTENGILVRINPTETDIPDPKVNISLPIGGLQALKKIDEELENL